MTLVDAKALINDFEYCTQDKICYTKHTFQELQDWANGIDVPHEQRNAAHKIGQWLYDNPDKHCHYNADMAIDRSLTGDIYFAANVRLVNGAWQYVPQKSNRQTYYGWREVRDEKFVAALYDGAADNWYDFGVNEYAMAKGGAFRCFGDGFARVKRQRFSSEYLGVIEPKDVYQQCAFDSLVNNDITVLYGMAGSGKTLLPLAYALQELESGKLRRVHFIFHYEKLKHSRELGYVKGDQLEKMIKSGSLGNILSSKLGDLDSVKRLIRDGQFNVIPTSSIRGFEAGDDEMIFCTEAQDLDPYTIKTIIQRAKTGCKICLEGDADEQTDISRESGLGKVIDVFKGQPYFGCVKLINDYRSGYGKLADLIV